MRFRIEHPNVSGIAAEYGFDPVVGFFVEIHGLNAIREYDRLHPGYRHLQGALDYLVRAGFFSQDVLYEALDLLIHQTPDEMPPRLAWVAQVVVNLKAYT